MVQFYVTYYALKALYIDNMCDGPAANADTVGRLYFTYRKFSHGLFFGLRAKFNFDSHVHCSLLVIYNYKLQ